ncbi:hypothetical protein OTU49_006878 [Cherax quadricarinatus]|uniref:Uncharacterized protein n=1 Tax=Cherax quadricarinatus TaxID=27406 RepID=A0AAW0WXC3_CHEQU|nr:UPF0488 protein C8orf33 homolog [Cherax quadricarinatus]
MPPKPQAKKGSPPKAQVVKDAPEEDSKDVALERFSLELRWCIQQLELSMEKKKGKSKQADDMVKAHKTLTNSKAPLIKKRQIMNALFGDYRKKMAEEEKKFRIQPPKMKSKCVLPRDSVFFKKSHEQLHHKTEDKESSTTEASSVNDSTDDTHSTEAQESCAQDYGEDKTNNDKYNVMLTDCKPTENTFKFNFSVPS